jgi:hypothetical protein
MHLRFATCLHLLSKLTAISSLQNALRAGVWPGAFMNWRVHSHQVGGDSINQHLDAI